MGFAKAGFNSQLVCENDKDACETLSLNLHHIGHNSNKIYPSDILKLNAETITENVDVIFGGPPCQGFSVAGKMNPEDSRSKLIFEFMKVVSRASPKGFICENVKALAVSQRWKDVRKELFRLTSNDYTSTIVLLNSSDFGTPQNRERMFLVGLRKDIFFKDSQELNNLLIENLRQFHAAPPRISEVIHKLGRAGTKLNPNTCTAKIVYAKNPVLRRSAYAGMLFNGAGRPLDINKFSSTLPASMGGNKTPIVDESEIFDNKESFIEKYHSSLLSGLKPRTATVPKRLRRLTLNECKAIQTFPADYEFYGTKSSIYKQIGNAVPCNLAQAIASAYSIILDEV